MKRIVFLILLLSSSIFAMAQKSRWKLIITPDTVKEKIYVDTTRTQKMERFDIHKNVIILWLKILSSPIKKGEYVQETDEKIAVDVAANQLEIKAILKKSSGVEIERNQFEVFKWDDVFPETKEEILLLYCKSL